MKRASALSAAVALVGASVAFGDILVSSLPNQTVKTPTQAGSYPVAPRGFEDFVTFNVAGIESWDAVVQPTDPNNTVVLLDVATPAGEPPGTPLLMGGIGWDVSITGEGTSWQSELMVYFDDPFNPDLNGLFLRPGAGSNTPGTGAFSDGPGVIRFGPGTAFPQIPLITLPNGVLRMEFGESFDDANNVRDGLWNSGVLELLIIYVPEPATLWVVAFGGVSLIRRRRA